MILFIGGNVRNRLENMDLMEILHFNAKEFKIVKGEIKALNMFYNETDSKHVKTFSLYFCVQLGIL